MFTNVNEFVSTTFYSLVQKDRRKLLCIKEGVPSPLLPFQGCLNLSFRVQETLAYHLSRNFEYSGRSANNGKVIFSGFVGCRIPTITHLTSKFKRRSSSPSLLQSMLSNVTHACSPAVTQTQSFNTSPSFQTSSLMWTTTLRLKIPHENAQHS